jgi:dTDP-L-rhamnose 4-epimerase
VHVDDVAAANALSVQLVGERGFDAVNICSGQPVSIQVVAEQLSAASGGPRPVVTGQYRSGDVRHIVADPARARENLGFSAQIGFATGLKEFAKAPLRG